MMRLSTLSYVFTALALVVIIAMAGALASHKRTYDSANHRLALSERIQVTAFQLSNLTAEYILHPHERSARQWKTRREKLAELIGQLGETYEVEPPVFRDIEAAISALDADFSRLLNLSAVDGVESGRTMEGALQLFVGQLLRDLQDVSRNSELLIRENVRKIDEAFETGLALVVGVTAFFFMTLGGLWLFIIRGVVVPGMRLKRAVVAIGEGDLDQRVSPGGPAEFREIGEDINTMAANLGRITASRDKLDDEIKRRESLEEALRGSNAELQQFAYVASHDLREPLRMISSYLRLIERKLGDGLEGEIREFMDFAVDGAQRMDRLILDLLEYSRVETQGQPFTGVDTDDILRESLDNLKLKLEEKGAQISYGHLPMVHGDPTQVTRLIQNLVENGLKYHAPERSPVIDIQASEADGMVRFAVRDNGIGIEAEFHDRVFEIFSRLHAPGEYEGTGIGLAVCRRIAERHGGRIWFESEVGQGSTFFFTLPAAG